MFKKNKLEIHTKPKQTTQINRPLIITASIVIATVFMLSIISAFTTSTKKTKTEAATTTDKKSKTKTDKTTAVISPMFKDLPENYSDVAGIKKYIPEAKNNKFDILMNQFSRLQNQYTLLRKQFDAIKRQPTQPIKPAPDIKTMQARSSDLAFSGLSSGVDSMVGGNSSSSRRSKIGKKDEDLEPTKEQVNLIKQKTENTRAIEVHKGKDRTSEIYDMHNMIKPISPYQIQAGSILSATLISGIDTTLRGTIIAQIRTNVYDTVTGKHLLIPKGSKILGQYNSRIDAGQRRILLAFKRIVRPDGKSILLGSYTGIGVDAAGKSGIEGNVNNHWARIIGASTISTILNVGAGIASDSSGNNNNSNLSNSKQKAFGGAASGIASVGEKIVNQAVAIQPTIDLPPGHQFNVTINRDMILEPYKQRR